MTGIYGIAEEEISGDSLKDIKGQDKKLFANRHLFSPYIIIAQCHPEATARDPHHP
jgi:hypothetical protein